MWAEVLADGRLPLEGVAGIPSFIHSFVHFSMYLVIATVIATASGPRDGSLYLFFLPLMRMFVEAFRFSKEKCHLLGFDSQSELKKSVIFIGGLTDGFMSLPYLEHLIPACHQ